MCTTEQGLVVRVQPDVADVVTRGRTRRLPALLVPDLEVGDTVLVGLGTILARIETPSVPQSPARPEPRPGLLEEGVR